jgi:hypothetical protein
MEGTFFHMGSTFLLEAASGRQINLTADDGFYSPFNSAPVKIHSTKEVAMVGYRNRWHPVSFSLLNELFYSYCAVEKAVFCVQMEGDIICM